MKEIFQQNPIYIKRARKIAVLWTLLIFILCFLPGQDIPEIDIPLIDKWAHMLLFGVFTYIWHCTVPSGGTPYKLILVLIALFMGWLVEYAQGHFIPNRSQDNVDTLADVIGGILGVMIYTIIYYTYRKRNTRIS